MVDRDKQGDGRDSRHSHGNHQLCENHQIVGAVYLGGLLQLRGDCLEKIDEDNDVEGIEHIRQNQRPKGVDDSGVSDHQIGRDDAAVKQHGEDQKDGKETVPVEIGPGHSVGHGAGYAHPQGRPDNGAEHGNPEGTVKPCVGKGDPVCLQGKSLRPENHCPFPHIGGVADGNRDDIVKGKDAQDCEKGHGDIAEDNRRVIGIADKPAVLFGHMGCPPFCVFNYHLPFNGYHSPLSKAFRLMALQVVKRINPTTDWNSPIEVVRLNRPCPSPRR